MLDFSQLAPAELELESGTVDCRVGKELREMYMHDT
jgi:hypothetical protein